MTVRIDEHGCLIVGNCALPAAVVPAVEDFYREKFAQAEPYSEPSDAMVDARRLISGTLAQIEDATSRLRRYVSDLSGGHDAS